MSSDRKFAKDLIKYIDKSPTAFHSVKEMEKKLLKNGFKELKLENSWHLEKGGKYYTTKNGSAIVAFEIGNGNIAESGFRIIGSHTDSPGFRVKPNPEILVAKKYLQLNTEVYGGPILSTWFDRPLSLAGRVTIKTKDILSPKQVLVDFKKPIINIPNLAIHMNREANTGFEVNPQKHTLPIISMVNSSFEKDDFLLEILAEELDLSKESILDFELQFYEVEKGSLVGLNEEFISVGKLDNLAMVHASMHGLIDAKVGEATNVVVAFDNEEVGSGTKQGAGSPMFKNILERVVIGLNGTKEDYYRAIENTFLISSDQAHAIHPNFIEKSDPTNKPIINEGPTIKIAANQAYTSDSFSSGVFESIARSLDIPIQKFVNRSDLRGGSTIGPISSSQLPVASVDIGNPILAMHSIREFGGVKDHYNIYKIFKEFYSI